jgi:hypothetical protein
MSDEVRFSHCDQDVLHAPGECSYCDTHPEAQRARKEAGINFTGHRKEGMLPCPSEKRRPLVSINRWPGNRPLPKPS